MKCSGLREAFSLFLLRLVFATFPPAGRRGAESYPLHDKKQTKALSVIAVAHELEERTGVYC